MTTVRDIIQDALFHIGALAHGESLNANDSAFGLRELNRMISAWNTEDTLIYVRNRETFSFVAAQQSYTMGSGGNLNTTRPVEIDMVSVLISGGTTEIPIDIVTEEQWRDITVKATSSTFPLVVHIGGEYPLRILEFWPVPSEVNTLVIYSWGQTAAFANESASVSFPPGYEDALVSNLAVRLAPSYGIQPNPVLLTVAQTSKSRIKKINSEPTFRTADSVLLGSHNSIGARSRGYVIDP